MTHENDSAFSLLLLVGSNPLPNYLAACALQTTRVVLVFTAETKDAKDRLRSALGSSSVKVNDAFIDDATCATVVRRAIDEQLSSAGDGARLNYTGGTKVMAAHARMAFAAAGGRPEHSSYLDEGSTTQEPRLRFDDGTSKALSECHGAPLTLQVILALHGISLTPRSIKEPSPTGDDAREILRKVLANVELASQLYEERRRLAEIKKPSTAIQDPFSPAAHELNLSQLQIPRSADMNRAAFARWYKFIGGEWLEEWLGEQVRGLHLAPTPEIVVGVNAQRGSQNANLEVDIAVVRGHRSYFISCTTDTTKHICKPKLFEIAVRSRQLGGDLARAALICLADDKTVGALQADVDDIWRASNTTRVFGLSDIRTWAGGADGEANLMTLKNWLES